MRRYMNRGLRDNIVGRRVRRGRLAFPQRTIFLQPMHRVWRGTRGHKVKRIPQFVYGADGKVRDKYKDEWFD